MAPEVFFTVCYGEANPPQEIQNLHTFTPATLYDHCRHRVKYADYPAVVADEGKSVNGIFATGLTDANMQMLDDFEGSEYERKAAQVTLNDEDSDSGANARTRDTSVYIFLNEKDLERREWDFDHFRQQRLDLWTRNELSFSRNK